MFRFAHPEYLYLLTLIPVFIVLYLLFWYRQKKRMAKFGDMSLVKDLMIGVSPLRRHLKFSLLMLALALAVFLCARPQYGTRNEEVKRQGIEAIIAVDVSNSMLCQDVKPSRLDKSKMLVSKLIEQLDQDRIGLVAFAGSAITLLPITSDYVSAKMFLDQLSPATIALQGTNMAEAIQRATAGFSDKTNVGKALILITDAEDHEDGAVEAAKEADKKGISIYVLSVGTEQGGPIPLGNGNYKKDNSGNTVTTKLNEEVGKQIAKAAGGVYIKVDQTDQAQRLLETEIEKMQKEDISTSMYSEYDEQFVAVAILLLLVLIAEVCIMEKKNPLLHGLRLFKDNKK
ncbi:MAG: VWA domain-containing protein [Bacteroidaceae bacterium]|nr:VWA domain-containing protein [Bacteroidaceae bacterium]